MRGATLWDWTRFEWKNRQKRVALAEYVPSMEQDVAAGLTSGLRRARSWRVPPNWSATDWYEELHMVALATAWQAEQDYDPSRAGPARRLAAAR